MVINAKDTIMKDESASEVALQAALREELNLRCDCWNTVTLESSCWCGSGGVDGKESKTECPIVLCAHPLEIEVRTGMCSVDSECTSASPNQKRLPCLSSRTSPPEIDVEPPTTVGFGLCSDAIHDFLRFCLHCIGAEHVKTWLVSLASELDCTVTYCGSHVKGV